MSPIVDGKHAYLSLTVASILAGASFSGGVKSAVAAEAAGIQEVLVTARRREESLQEVPLSIAALGTEDLEQRNVTDLRQINGTVPNVVIQTRQFGGNSGQFRMRGLPGVSVYQDGAVLNGGTLPQFTDIERVEVLRGPQGTLFGRASTGGAIQIITRKPSDTFGAEVRTVLGTDDRVDLTANVNIPITDSFFAKFTGSSLQRDGYVTSTRVDTDFGNQDDKMARVDLLWRPVESVEARVQYMRSKSQGNGIPYVNFGMDSVCNNNQIPDYWRDADGRQLFQAPNAWCLYTTVDLDPATPGVQPFASDFQSYGSIEEYKNTIATEDTDWWETINDVRADVSWDINDTMTLRAIGSRRWGREASYEDLDGTAYNLFVNDLNNFVTDLADTRTAELQFIYSGSRLSGTTGVYWENRPGSYGRRLNWLNNELSTSVVIRTPANVAGSYSTTAIPLNPAFWNAVNAAYPGFMANPPSRPFLLAVQNRIQKTEVEVRALFTEWTYSITDALRATAGIRYTEEDSTAFRFTTAQTVNELPAYCCTLPPGFDPYLGGGSPSVEPGAPFEQFTPRFSVQYQWNPDIMTYLTYAIAKIGSGTQVVPPAVTGRAPFFTAPSNVKSYEIGLRSDLLGGSLRFNMSAFFNDYKNAQLSEEVVPGLPVAANADAEVKGAEIEGTWLASDAFTVNYGIGWVDAKYTTRGTTFNMRPGAPFPNTPEYTYNIGGTYDWRLDAGSSITFRADYNWQDMMLSNVDRITATETPDYGLLSARLGYRPAEGNWDVALSATNLTDLYYITGSFRQPQAAATTGQVGRPREFALNFNVRFE